MSPRVSIILPTYNGSKFIHRAIYGVLSQTYDDWELLVIDDGSIDDTGKITSKFSAEDKRIRYFRSETNKGIQKSLNRGLIEAGGDYVARIDDDDEWVNKDKLKKQVEFFDNFPEYVLVGTGTVVADESGKELFRFLNPETDEIIRRRLLGKNCFTHSSVMFKREAALKFGGYDETDRTKHVEDYDLWLKLGTVGKLANLPIHAVRFTLRPGNISSRNKIAQFKKDISLTIKHKNEYPGYFSALARGYVRLVFYGILSLPPLSALKNKILKIYKEN